MRMPSGRQDRRWIIPVAAVCALGAVALAQSGAFARGQTYESFTTPTPLGEGETLVVGFMGGREPWDNPMHVVRRIALSLRSKGLPGVHVETVENRKRRLAVELVRHAFDRDRNGRLDEHERGSARVVVYGQSFGGAAVLKFARELDEIGVPVLLAVQMDSVGRDDRVVPPNVARAANLFQRDGLVIRGEPEIVAADPERTVVLGNFEYDYRDKAIDVSQVSWFKKLFRVAHTKFEHDPEVSAKVEALIMSDLRPADAAPGPAAGAAGATGGRS
jgi:hypothetical protein